MVNFEQWKAMSCQSQPIFHSRTFSFERFVFVALFHQSRQTVQGNKFTRWTKSIRWIYRSEDSMLWTPKSLQWFLKPRSVQYCFVMCARRSSIARPYSNVIIAPILEKNLTFVRFVQKDSAHRARWTLIAGFTQVNILGNGVVGLRRFWNN